MTGFLRDLPKIELHLHLEGALTPWEALALAKKRDPSRSEAEVLSLFRHRSLGEFLAHFGAVVDLFSEPEDMAWLLHRLARRLRRQGVLYAEIRVSPSVWERHGLPAAETLVMLLESLGKSPLDCRFIVDAVRQWDRALVERDLEMALSMRNRGVVAFGLGGDEALAPAEGFADLAEECRRLGFPLVPHAGEGNDPGTVASALRVFRPARLGHGIASAGDPRLMEELKRQGVHLEVCPTSNRRTGAVPRGRHHPLRELWAKGVSLSLNTDDPGLFGATLTGELSWAVRRAGWTRKDAVQSQRAAAAASFIEPGRRDGLLRAVG